jgi:hypothetical protein
MSPCLIELTLARFLAGYRRDDPVGDLANDFRRDSNAPRTDGELRAYFHEQAGSSGLVNGVVERAWRAYRRALRREATR